MLRRPDRMAVTALFGALAVGLTAGCGIQQKDLDGAMAQVRQEMQQGDDGLSSRIDAMDRRVGSLESELQSLRNDFNATMENMEGMMKFSVPVHFGYDVAALRELDKPLLDRFPLTNQSRTPAARDRSPGVVWVLRCCGDGVVGVGEVDDSGPVVLLAFGFDLDRRKVEAELVADNRLCQRQRCRWVGVLID